MSLDDSVVGRFPWGCHNFTLDSTIFGQVPNIFREIILKMRNQQVLVFLFSFFLSHPCQDS